MSLGPCNTEAWIGVGVGFTPLAVVVVAVKLSDDKSVSQHPSAVAQGAMMTGFSLDLDNLRTERSSPKAARFDLGDLR